MTLEDKRIDKIRWRHQNDRQGQEQESESVREEEVKSEHQEKPPLPTITN